VYVLLKSWGHDAFDDLGFQKVLPVIFDLQELSVELGFLIFLEGLYEAVLFFNKILDLILFVRVVGVYFQLLCELLHLLHLALQLLSVLLVLLLKVQKQLFILNFLLSNLAHLGLFLGNVFMQLLVVSLKVLRVALLNAEHFFKTSCLFLKFFDLFLLLENLLSHFLDHSLVLKTGFVLDLHLCKLLLLSVNFFKQDIHISEFLFVFSDHLLLAFVIFKLFLELLALSLDLVTKTCKCLSELPVLLLNFVRGKVLKDIFFILSVCIRNLGQEFLLLSLKQLNLNCAGFEINLVPLVLFFQILNLDLLTANLFDHFEQLFFLLFESLLKFSCFALKLRFHIFKLFVVHELKLLNLRGVLLGEVLDSLLELLLERSMLAHQLVVSCLKVIKLCIVALA